MEDFWEEGPMAMNLHSYTGAHLPDIVQVYWPRFFLAISVSQFFSFSRIFADMIRNIMAL